MEEFSEDPAFQQVYIERKILAKEAEMEGMNFLECIRAPGSQIHKGQ